MIFNSINIEITDDCNLQCVYCYRIKRNKNRKSFNYKINKRYNLKSIKDSGIKNVAFTGGEPTIKMNELEKKLNYFNNKNIEILTNAINRIDFLNKVNKLSISLDGLSSEYNFNRSINNNIYNTILENIKYYISKDVKININTVITKQNLNKLLFLFPCNQIIKNISLSIMPVSDTFTNKELRLSEKDIKYLYNNIYILSETYKHKINIRHDLIKKSVFMDYYGKSNPIYFFPEYNIITNYFYYFNRQYVDIKEMNDDIDNISFFITNKIIKMLKCKSNDFIFSPYNYAEKIMYEYT